MQTDKHVENKLGKRFTWLNNFLQELIQMPGWNKRNKNNERYEDAFKPHKKLGDE